MKNIQLIKKKPIISIDSKARAAKQNRVPELDYSPSQKDTKKPRAVNYIAFPEIKEMCRDIISLYVYVGLGESAIRHVIGLSTDKMIEDVARQHMLGRTNLDTYTTKLECPNKKELTKLDISIIQSLCDKYETLNDPYIIKLLQEHTWKDDPAYIKERICPNCGNLISVFEDNFCSHCGKQLRKKFKGKEVKRIE